MIRIKNYMFNMDKITMIKYFADDDELMVSYIVGDEEEDVTIKGATLDDIRLEEVI